VDEFACVVMRGAPVNLESPLRRDGACQMHGNRVVGGACQPRCTTTQRGCGWEERVVSVEITHIRLSGGNGHEHIVSYRWRNPSEGNSGSTDKPTMVAWVDEPANRAFVGSGARRSEVGVVRPQSAQPYLRTFADGQWDNNLLSLPHF
jgi:hypothetical protein